MLPVVAVLLILAAECINARRHQCPHNAQGLAFKMLESDISRREGIEASSASTSTIELGIFQQALRESIAFTRDAAQRDKWSAYHRNSTGSAVKSLSSAAMDSSIPLDRFSVGSSMIYDSERTHDEAYLPAISALKASVTLQERNANGGLWYYANPSNLTAYHNLSYSDGMFSYPLFAVLAAYRHKNDDCEDFGPSAALKQIEILHDICKIDSGLVVHGYDASGSHTWANNSTGASPIVWGRSLAWFTLGVANTLEALQHADHHDNEILRALRRNFVALVRAQVAASEHSLRVSGSFGVWQVVDQPGATFAGSPNFVEASASCMTVHSLLKGIRLGLIKNDELEFRATSAAMGIYQNVLEKFLIYNGNGTLSLTGTSSVATLSGDVDAVYYVTRTTLLNSLIGTGAFVLAALEVERIC